MSVLGFVGFIGFIGVVRAGSQGGICLKSSLNRDESDNMDESDGTNVFDKSDA